MTSTIHSILSRDKALTEAKEVRLRLLKNGYTPLPAEQKQVFMEGWPDVRPTAEMIEEWSRHLSRRTTAIRIEGDLVAIDIDVNDPDMAQRMMDLIYEIAPDVFHKAPMRYGKGAKVMLLCRCPSEQVGIIKSRKFGDENDDNHLVEMFGGGTVRYFTCFGPHTEGAMTADGVEVLVMYEWADSSPLDTKPDQLPVITRDQMIRISHRAGEIMEAYGWTPVAKSKAGEVSESGVADLTPEMTFDLDTGVTIPFEELEAHAGRRCSAKWQDGLNGHATTRCLIDYDRHQQVVRILDFDDYTWHYPEGWDVRPKRVKDDEKQKSSALRLGELLGGMLEGERTEYSAPPTPDVSIEDDGWELEAEAFQEWLLLRYAYFPNGAAAERVVDMYDGRVYPLEGFHGMWVSKSWFEDTGEEYTKGPREGEPKVVKVMPTKVWFDDRRRATIRGYRFDPTCKDRIVRDKGLWLNLYKGPEPTGVSDPPEECFAWWEDFLHHLLPNDDEREWFINWLAYKYKHPAARGQGVIMVSPTGDAGRGVLFRILGAVFQNHVARPSATDLTGMNGQAQFNGWVENTVLALVDELMTEEGGIYAKKKAYEAIKENVDPLPKSITVNEKNRAKRTAISHMSLISATNHIDALPIPHTDRRLTVLENGEKLSARPDLLKRYDALQDELGRYLPEFVEAVRQWLLSVYEDGEPMEMRDRFLQVFETNARADMIEGAEGKIDKMLRDVLRRLEANGRPAVLLPEIVAMVETEAKAQGHGAASGLVMAVESEVRAKLRTGFEGWLNDRKPVRISEDRAVAPTRNLVALGSRGTELTIIERMHSVNNTRPKGD